MYDLTVTVTHTINNILKFDTDTDSDSRNKDFVIML